MKLYDNETGETHRIDIFKKSEERAKKYGDRFVLPSIFHYYTTIYGLVSDGRLEIIPDD